MRSTEESLIADYYEAYHAEPWQGAVNLGFPACVERLFQSSIQAGQRCLDVGCGDGQAAGLRLEQMGCAYFGVDISQTAVTKAHGLGLNARRVDSSDALPFTDEFFDVAVSLEVIEHLFSPEQTLMEIWRVLRPGGALIVTTPNVAYWRRRVDLAVLGRWNPFGYPMAVEQPWADPHIRFFNPGNLRRLLLKAGFTSLRLGGHGGSLLGEIPWVGKKWRRPGFRASKSYEALEACCPSVFACFLNVVARKPL